MLIVPLIRYANEDDWDVSRSGGALVARVGGKEVVACRGMARPFTAMKALDMDAVAKQVIALL